MWDPKDVKEALKILWDGARKDPINGAIMPLIGIGILFWIWYEGWVSWNTIHAFICYDLPCG